MFPGCPLATAEKSIGSVAAFTVTPVDGSISCARAIVTPAASTATINQRIMARISGASLPTPKGNTRLRASTRTAQRIHGPTSQRWRPHFDMGARTPHQPLESRLVVHRLGIECVLVEDCMRRLRQRLPIVGQRVEIGRASCRER